MQGSWAARALRRPPTGAAPGESCRPGICPPDPPPTGWWRCPCQRPPEGAATGPGRPRSPPAVHAQVGDVIVSGGQAGVEIPPQHPDRAAGEGLRRLDGDLGEGGNHRREHRSLHVLGAGSLLCQQVLMRAAQAAASMFRSLGRRRTKRSSGPRKPPTATVVFPMSMVSSMAQTGSRAARGARLSLRAFPMGMHDCGDKDGRPQWPRAHRWPPRCPE